MIEFDPTRFKTRPFRHQLEGVKAFVRFNTFALFDEMRLGKSKQVIDAACLLHEDRRLELVVIVAPASVRGVWTNADDPVGEIKKHAWVPSIVREFHARGLKTAWGDKNGRRLEWWVTNYEFIRQPERRRELELAIAHHDVNRGHKTWLVLDESSFVKSHRSRQAKACLALRRRFARASILNGTPWSHSPLDLYAQMLFLSPRILGFRNFWEFRYRYAVMGGWMNKQVIKYQNLEELTNLIRPWCLRRRLEDVFDMPEPVESFREVALAPATWAHYRTVRDELIAWLDGTTPVIVASTAAVRVLRLAQLTGGFLGGVSGHDLRNGELIFDEEARCAPLEVSAEKMNATLEVIEDARANDRPVIVWCRFRAERERFVVEARKRGWPTYEIHGGQKKVGRNEARAAFTYDSTTQGFRVLFGQPQAGGFGLDLAAGAVVVYASSDFNALTRWQSEARAKHPEKTAPIEYVDVLATGPKGQRTVDHLIRKVLKQREDLATWTSARWRKELTDE